MGTITHLICRVEGLRHAHGYHKHVEVDRELPDETDEQVRVEHRGERALGAETLERRRLRDEVEHARYEEALYRCLGIAELHAVQIQDTT